jgi:DNA-directed RNA polymerase specialized sigma24 family protein
MDNTPHPDARTQRWIRTVSTKELWRVNNLAMDREDLEQEILCKWYEVLAKYPEAEPKGAHLGSLFRTAAYRRLMELARLGQRQRRVPTPDYHATVSSTSAPDVGFVEYRLDRYPEFVEVFSHPDVEPQRRRTCTDTRKIIYRACYKAGRRKWAPKVYKQFLQIVA